MSNTKDNAKKERLNLKNSTKEDANNNRQVTQNENFTTKEDANFHKRVREITVKNCSFAGIVNFDRVRSRIQCNSTLEKDFMYLLEYDRSVKNYLEQPFSINYKDSKGKLCEYFPDFIVEYSDGKPTKLVEVKYSHILKNQEKELTEKIIAAENFCNNNNFEFCIITESFIREEKKVELLNYKFLERYRSFFENINKDETAYPIFNTDVALLRNKMKSLKSCTVESLIKNITDDRDKQAELIFLNWFMVANRFFIADLSKKLTLNSIICLD